MMGTAIYFWQIILIIMSLEVIVCEVQCYINVYYFFLLPSNLQFPCQTVTHVWTSVYTSQSRSFLSQEKKKIIQFSLLYNILWQKTLSWNNWLCWRITNVAAPPRSSNPQQCGLPNDKTALFRNIAIAKWFNSSTKRMFRIWKSCVLREMLPRSKTHPDSGNGLVGHYGWWKC